MRFFDMVQVKIKPLGERTQMKLLLPTDEDQYHSDILSGAIGANALQTVEMFANIFFNSSLLGKKACPNLMPSKV